MNKPAGMVVHPAAGHAGGTLVNALLHHVDGSQRHRRRAAAGHRAPARSRHVRADRGRQARPGPRVARAAVPRSRGREGIPRAGLGRRAGRTPDRRGDRARPGAPAEDVGASQAGAHGGDPHHARAAPARRDARADRHPHGTHAPDPRAPERDRPPDRGRRALRRIPPAGASGPAADPPPGAAVPARRTACVHASRSTGGASSSPPRCRPICRRCWTRFCNYRSPPADE